MGPSGPCGGECKREREVLARRTGLVEIRGKPQLGQLDDGWAEQLPNLEVFSNAAFGIEVP